MVQVYSGSSTSSKNNYSYNAFGTTDYFSDTDTPNKWGYCDQLIDQETGYYYLCARYYNPATGTFISEDPAFDGINWYSYCGGNPVRFADISGLDIVLVNRSEGAKGLHHMGAVVQNEAGDWYYFSWETEVFFDKIDESALNSFTAFNAALESKDLLPKDEDTEVKDYDIACYIKGDFTDAYEAFAELKKEYDSYIDKNGESGASEFRKWFNKNVYGATNEKYGLVANNCSEVVMKNLLTGTLADGTSVADYYSAHHSYVGMPYSVVPKTNMLIAQDMFYNSCLNEKGFTKTLQNKLLEQSIDDRTRTDINRLLGRREPNE